VPGGNKKEIKLLKSVLVYNKNKLTALVKVNFAIIYILRLYDEMLRLNIKVKTRRKFEKIAY
jgi:NADH:ubiquinone oxidoreductase subunit C